MWWSPWGSWWAVGGPPFCLSTGDGKAPSALMAVHLSRPTVGRAAVLCWDHCGQGCPLPGVEMVAAGLTGWARWSGVGMRWQVTWGQQDTRLPAGRRDAPGRSAALAGLPVRRKEASTGASAAALRQGQESGPACQAEKSDTAGLGRHTGKGLRAGPAVTGMECLGPLQTHSQLGQGRSGEVLSTCPSSHGESSIQPSPLWPSSHC